MSSFDSDKYQPTIDAILSVSDLEKVSVKKIRRALQELFSVEFEDDKKPVNDLILERYHNLMESRQREQERRKKQKIEEQDAALAAKLQSEDGGRRRKTTSPKVVKPRKKRSPNANPNSSAISSLELNLSPKLSALLNKTKLPRTQVVKEVWDYIKLNNLQNPSDKREIICDDKMSEIFGKKVSMFQMNKVLSNHLYRDDE